MKLYFSPLACSMATRIALYEAGASATFIEVDPITKRTRDGDDYRAVHPLGLVPCLRTDDGELVTENAAILQYLAEQLQNGGLAPGDPLSRTRLRQWLSFIGTELHKATFAPLFDPHAPDNVKSYVVEKSAARLAFLNTHLEGREFLLESFTVADAYLVTVLNWAQATPISLERFPAVTAYLERHRHRDSVARALSEEVPLYLAERARHAAA